MIKPIHKKAPSYFYNGERRAQILHTRLRNHNMDLNQNLFNRNLMVSPWCRCGDTAETAYHYLLDCPLHIDTRLTMWVEIDPGITITVTHCSGAVKLHLMNRT